MEAKRQVGIKTRSVKRLAADVRSYETERTGYQTKLDTLTASSSSEAHELKRAREFVEEADSTLQDVRQRLQEAYTGLHNYLHELTLQNDAELLADQCMVDARQMLADVAPLVTVAGGAAASSAAGTGRIFKISVFGGSQLNEDDALWRTTEELGERLAREAYHVVSGGYTGTSESLSFGASRIADSKIEGVTLASSSASSSSYASAPNQYLTVETKVGDQLERVTTLVRQADAFVVLPGGLGTLAKLTLAWNVAAAASPSATSSSNGLVILAWRAPWESLIESLSSTLGILPEVRACIQYVDSVDEIMRALDQMKQEKATAAK